MNSPTMRGGREAPLSQIICTQIPVYKTRFCMYIWACQGTSLFIFCCTAMANKKINKNKGTYNRLENLEPMNMQLESTWHFSNRWTRIDGEIYLNSTLKHHMLYDTNVVWYRAPSMSSIEFQSITLHSLKPAKKI